MGVGINLQLSQPIDFAKGILREEPLMIWGGRLGQKRGKKLNGYSPREKNSTQQPGRKKKSSAGWPGKKTISRLARKKKTQHEFSA